MQGWHDGRIQTHPGVAGRLDEPPAEHVIEYLLEENRVLEEQQGSGRPKFMDEQRRGSDHAQVFVVLRLLVVAGLACRDSHGTVTRSEGRGFAKRP